MVKKKPLTGLFRDNPATPEGKYLVKRRDSTVPEWPSFVLGAKDPIAVAALHAYAAEIDRVMDTSPTWAAELGFTREFAKRIHALAQEFDEYRRRYGYGDPGMGPHRKDDPATIEEMRKGMSA